MNQILQGNAIDTLKNVLSDTVDLVYLDPPFFTQRKHQLKNKSNQSFEFDDHWNSLNDYKIFIKSILIECYRVLKSTGSIFLHCDKTAAHHLRIILDDVFGAHHFQSEIIWTYRRWSNAKKGLLNSHQNIFFYSKTANYTFCPIYTDYSPATNLDQILQDRIRNAEGKSAYKVDADNQTVISKAKKGVPLSDVWDIPFLNPKAKERVGYPTQKPVFLLQRIIEIATHEGDTVLDPMCGSGTTGVAAKSLNRNFIGIDVNPNAIELTKKRLEEMVISGSKVMAKGKQYFFQKSNRETAILEIINAFPVQRNTGIDGFLKDFVNEKPVPIKIQKASETLKIAYNKLQKATWHSRYELKVLIRTIDKEANFEMSDDVILLDALDLSINRQLNTRLKPS